jgi:hypothetical protein
MASPECERAIEDATRYGNALLKFISRNDAGITGSHQAGFYLPKANDVWRMFSPHEPKRGYQAEEIVNILWQDGRRTESKLTWYGNFSKTPGVTGRAEYRLTRFGKDFPFLNSNTVGNLLVLVPIDHHNFRAYVLDQDDDIEDIQATLGVEAFESWGVYQGGAAKVEDENDCVERRYREFTEPLGHFPSGEIFSAAAVSILEECKKNFAKMVPDDALMAAMEREYSLFKFVERRLCQEDILRAFTEVDDFLNTAARIMNRRKSRAGRSLENHVHQFLIKQNIPHEMRVADIPGKPDVVIPSAAAYFDETYPVEKLFIVGVKTTCKDRWRQVLNEGKRVSDKHIITIQPGISAPQLEEMRESRVTLVVPEKLHGQYPPEKPMELLTLATFVETVRGRL